MSRRKPDDFEIQFIAWAKANNFRLLWVDGEVRVYPRVRSKTKAGIHFFDGYRGGVGLWLQAKSPRRLDNLAKRLDLPTALLRNKGLNEAIYVLPWDLGARVGKALKCDSRPRIMDV